MPPLLSPAERSPALVARLTVAVGVATLAAALACFEPMKVRGHPTDFGQVWFGAVALLQRMNPYELIGPNLPYAHDFPLVYPLTASIAVLPLGLLNEIAAGAVFIWISTVLLAFALTVGGWHRLPLFLSAPFIGAAFSRQWSPLLMAAAYIPWLGWAFVLKPNIGLAFLLSAPSKQVVRGALVGGTVLIAVSLLILPEWPADWLAAVQSASHVQPPIAHPGGFLVLLALLRWRLWEARLIIALACIPQTPAWYDILPLLLVAQTFRQHLVLSLMTSCGFLYQALFMRASDVILLHQQYGALLVASGYLPALLLVLLRPNEGATPIWLERHVAALRGLLGSAAALSHRSNPRDQIQDEPL